MRVLIASLQSTNDQLPYFVVQKDEATGFMKIKETKTISVATLVLNVIPRLILFMLKDNFSDFEGIKVIACAREGSEAASSHSKGI